MTPFWILFLVFFLIVFVTVGVKVPASDGAAGESPWHSRWPAAPATGLTALFSCLLCEVNGPWLWED